MPFISFPCLIDLEGTLGIVLNRDEYACLCLAVVIKSSQFFSVIVTFAVGGLGFEC